MRGDDIVLDCFAGSGTTLVAAEETGRRWIGIDNSKVAIEICQKRINKMKRHSSYSLFGTVKIRDYGNIFN